MKRQLREKGKRDGQRKEKEERENKCMLIDDESTFADDRYTVRCGGSASELVCRFCSESYADEVIGQGFYDGGGFAWCRRVSVLCYQNSLLGFDEDDTVCFPVWGRQSP